MQQHEEPCNLPSSPDKATRRNKHLQNPFSTCVHNTQLPGSFFLLHCFNRSCFPSHCRPSPHHQQCPLGSASQVDHVTAEGTAWMITKIYLHYETITVWCPNTTHKRKLIMLWYYRHMLVWGEKMGNNAGMPQIPKRAGKAEMSLPLQPPLIMWRAHAPSKAERANLSCSALVWSASLPFSIERKSNVYVILNVTYQNFQVTFFT